MLDEELATLHPAYRTNDTSETLGMRYGAQARDDTKSVPVATIRINNSSH